MSTARLQRDTIRRYVASQLLEWMVVTTATPVLAASWAALASGPRISPTTMISGLNRSAMSSRAI